MIDAYVISKVLINSVLVDLNFLAALGAGQPVGRQRASRKFTGLVTGPLVERDFPDCSWITANPEVIPGKKSRCVK